MSKAITFFRNRQQDGRTYELEIEGPVRSCRAIIYSRKLLEEALVRSPRQLRGSLDDEVDRIRQTLLRAEGGVLALIYEEDRERFLLIVPVSPEGKAAFGSFGLLLPGHPSLRLESLSEKRIGFPPGSHALIPVDKEAEESLRGFQDYLGYLPLDQESLILHAIRDPSLDLRVGRLEATALKSTAGPAAVPIRGAGVAGASNKSWLKRPVPVWPVAAVVLGLMLTVNSVLLYLNLQPDDDSAEVSVKPEEPNKKPTKREEGKATATEKMIGKVLEVSRKKNPFNALDTTHFSGVQNEGHVAAILVSSNEKPNAQGELLVRGLMKLEAFRINPEEGKKIFSPYNNPTAVYNFYNNDDHRLDGDSLDMLAALTCRLYRSPELKKPGSEESVKFAESCDQDLSLEKASPGLERLLKFVQEYKPEEA